MKEDFFYINLEVFKKSATSGYKIAKTQQEKLSNTLKNAKEQIQGVLDIFNKAKYMDTSVTDSLGNQLIEISKSFDDLEVKTNEDILNLKKSLSLFVTVKRYPPKIKKESKIK